MTNRGDDRRLGEGKRLSNLHNQEAYPSRLTGAQTSSYRSSDGWIGVDGGSIPVQGEQIGFFRRLRECCFRMDDIAPALHLANLTRRFLTRLDAHLLLPRSERHLMDFYLASGFPDHEIWHIGMCFFLSISESKLHRLASVLSYGGVTVEEQGQFAFLKGLALDSLVGFAGDGIAQVVPDGRHTPDIACWWLAFEGHDISSSLYLTLLSALIFIDDREETFSRLR